MRARARARCIWPDEEALRLAWQQVDLDRELPLNDEAVLQPREAGLPRVVLQAGEHLRPGAAYRVEDPGLTVGELTGALGGTATDRTLHAAYRDLRHRDARVVLDWHGLDVQRALTSTSTLPYLRWDLDVRHDPDRFLDVTVKLNWLRVRVRARMVAAQDGQELEMTAQVRGTGVWRPTLAPLLLALAPWVPQGMQELVQESADDLTGLALDPTGDPDERRRRLSRERAAARRAVEEVALGQAMPEVGRQLREVQDAYAALPWWRRAFRDREAWRGCYDQVSQGEPPAESWMEPRPGLDTVAMVRTLFGLREDAADRLQATPRGERPAAVDRVLLEVVGAHLKAQDPAQWRASDPHAITFARGRAGTPQAPPEPELETLDSMLDLAWLATPWSALRKAMGLDSDQEARAGLADLIQELREDKPL